VTHSGAYVKAGNASGICRTSSGRDIFYDGPTFGEFAKLAAIGEHYDDNVQAMDETSMNKDGATAISLCAPTNPTAQLSTTLAETMREGIPSLPGIQSWQKRAQAAKAAGSEYLNYQFGWAPLTSEVHGVVNAARHHRDIMQNYRHNEGRDVHRRFDFPTDVNRWEEEISPGYALLGITGNAGYTLGGTAARRTVSVETERKRWFEGCFTYGGPGGTDSFSRSLGFGSEADAVYGLTLSPDVLWNLAPWSWAVDWFTNTGDVIHNVTNFGLAGLVMRYGYMMEEVTHTYSCNYDDQILRCRLQKTPTKKYGTKSCSGSRRGLQSVRRSRCPANPFGFGVGWEGLSPTQLAITAALGITRVL
jgi:hypothetical protein